MDDAAVAMWVQGKLPEGVEATVERLRRMEGVVRVAVMPDVHVAGEFCVGTVVGSERVIFPQAVGGDIGCGMLAVRMNGEVEALRDEGRAARLLGALGEACPGRRHQRRNLPAMPEGLRGRVMADSRLEGVKNGEECRGQLGTLGAGNHFLEFQADEGGRLWMMIHTGSRHLGQEVLRCYLPEARRVEGGALALEAGSAAGRGYLRDVEVARAWARENRLLLAENAARAAEKVLGVRAEMVTLFDCDHNHVAREVHEGQEMWVHRKGATAAGAGMAGIVPGSMGTWSYHTEGRGCAASLASSSHGAGRAMSRAEARGRVTVAALRRQLRGVWYDARLERALVEEAPGAYKDVEGVMRAQEELTGVVRRLRPVLVYKGA